MDRTYIIQKAWDIKTKEDFLSLLNEIKADDLGDKYYPFEMRQLNYYCNPNHCYRRYRSFTIPKKAGGARTISAPGKGLKNILIYLNGILQAMYEPSAYAMGFVCGRSVVDNAKTHLNQNYVLNIDLKDFFPSIQQARIWKRLQLAPFNFNQDIASIIAGLCCMKVKRESAEGQKPTYDYVLPQGAPTSPIITNMICDTLDRRLAGVAKRFGLHYTRYADDITFSSMHNVYHEHGDFMNELHRIIAGQNFVINEAKTRLQKKGARQEVTGLTVSDRVNVTRKYIREIRSLLYIWEKYGFGVASSKFLPHYKAEKGRLKKGEPHLENVLGGKLLYLKMVKGTTNATYFNLQIRFNRLLDQMDTDKENSSQTPLKYIETKSVDEFEAIHHTKVEKAESKSGYQFAFFEESGTKFFISVSKQTVDIPLEKLCISLCEDGKKRFYLLHKPLYRLIAQIGDSPETPKTLDEVLANLYNSGFDLSKL